MRKQSDKSRFQGIQYNPSGRFASVNVDERLIKRRNFSRLKDMTTKCNIIILG